MAKNRENGSEKRSISSADKSAIKSELKAMSMKDLVATHRRLHQWAAQGNLLSGFTKADMEWLHNACEEDLQRRAEEDGRDPPEPTPLEWGGQSEEPVEDEDERWIPSTVKKIISKAKKKKQKKSFDDDNIERRYFTREVRMIEGEDGKRKIVGYGAVFNSLSEDLGGFQEIVETGAFDEVLDDDIRSLFNHDPNLILGRAASGTLVIEVDKTGLRYEVEPPDTQYARDLEVSIERGDVNQSSFGFRVAEETWEKPKLFDDLPTRRIHKFARLYDLGPVTFAAYLGTGVSMRALEQARRLTGGATGGDGDHSDEDQRAAGRLALMRRRLELAERK